jgi:hypothetical protein
VKPEGRTGPGKAAYKILAEVEASPKLAAGAEQRLVVLAKGVTDRAALAELADVGQMIHGMVPSAEG